ncbi:pseudouridine synthase, RluA family [Desulfosporosinus orientis DSM 765]|uniref:Pseudouridine synthase n=1 Tax=Desulfosporosinus orientis (strain ATCC 19365 / DSM 765 / NCIMB 8382 / VKM B-1628 / Singapore I) TaxID=768706 RepID=G7WH97_DESOD|nr:RluA family pseudouridine synthase [Desulfosporosinus orientis]AET70187.1 pseudouridine synthase, RluA family [Desulfosporosinus orientis DSM 765]
MDKAVNERDNKNDCPMVESELVSDDDLCQGLDSLISMERIELPEGVRLDVGVTEVLGRSRSYVQGLIIQNYILVNGLSKKANYKVRFGDKITVMVPPPQELQAEPENIPLEILYEDEDVLVVNKPQGMVVHPAPGAWQGTLVNALLFHCHNLSGINGVLRPGIVHRIDKDTSGILVVAKNDTAHQGLAAQLKAHSMERRYLTIVHGVIHEPSGTVDAPIGRDPAERKRMAVVRQHSKHAVTHYTVLKRLSETTFLEVRLETGRTHQIRVHMAYIKHPVFGDPVYGPKKNKFGLQGQMLHAAHLGFKHPVKGGWLEFDAPLPSKFAEVLEKLHDGVSWDV